MGFSIVSLMACGDVISCLAQHLVDDGINIGDVYHAVTIGVIPSPHLCIGLAKHYVNYLVDVANVNRTLGYRHPTGFATVFNRSCCRLAGVDVNIIGVQRSLNLND